MRVWKILFRQAKISEVNDYNYNYDDDDDDIYNRGYYYNWNGDDGDIKEDDEYNLAEGTFSYDESFAEEDFLMEEIEVFLLNYFWF